MNPSSFEIMRNYQRQKPSPAVLLVASQKPHPAQGSKDEAMGVFFVQCFRGFGCILGLPLPFTFLCPAKRHMAACSQRAASFLISSEWAFWMRLLRREAMGLVEGMFWEALQTSQGKTCGFSSQRQLPKCLLAPVQSLCSKMVMGWVNLAFDLPVVNQL